ncbi:DNA polymerase epsilon subunit 2 [Phtheirospermum japonicum]|uniref:DNA polymerase epsilon subunit n=1 Tax=Phtheirospermum japonicum TaxID=374723 RepID=A0A830BZ11_9LAMI|nr:DNA polymerase epsilon subunit 2 [Phtheirospermum japonicum]
MSSLMRNKVQRKFKMRGYTLKIEALSEVLVYLSHFPENEDLALELLLDDLHNSSLKSSILDKESIHKVASLLLEADEAGVDEGPSSSGYGPAVSALRIIDAFDFPKYRYDSIKKLFHKYTGNLPLHGDASAKVTLYRDRFQLLFQRLSRDPHFSRPVFGSNTSDYGSCQISPIQSLVGQKGKRWVMGLISQLEDGHFYLEDLTAVVEVDLSNAISFTILCNFLNTSYRITTGFFAENTIVLAEGEMLLDGIFQVKTCGFPPLEDREKSVSTFAGIDFFGGGSLTREETLRLAEQERGSVNDMFVILSDVWLDNEEKTMGKLEIILGGYENEDVVPSLFVFMGNFWSHPCNISFNSHSSIRSQFGKLGKMIAAHQRLKDHSRFLFIPGPHDIGTSDVLPRCSLPKYITEELQNHIPNAVFLSNPCRIKFYTQEIVFFRQDMLYRMRRTCLMPPSTEETSDPFEHLVATITHQSHLCPLPLSVQPIMWNYDHCLHLYPTPHTIVLGDKSEQKAFKYTGVTCFNPGSFSNDFTFVAYRPCSQEVELSAV